MGIREKINNNPAITTGATILIIVLAVFAIWYTSCSTNTPHISKNVFFTDDDGATWFAADATKIPPFTDDKGKEAVRCWVYSCDGKAKAGYLEKFSEEAKKQMESGPGGRPRMAEIRHMPGHLVKKPLDAAAEWIDAGNDPTGEAGEVSHVTCPGDATALPVPAP